VAHQPSRRQYRQYV